MAKLLELNQYLIREKFLKIFGNKFRIMDEQDNLYGFCDQKRFKIKEDLRIYDDENKIIGEIPTGYKFGWLPEHGLDHSTEAGSNLGNWDHKRDGSIRSGLKLTRTLSINLNYSQNFSTNRASSGLEQLSMQRDYFAYGEYMENGMPIPGWSFRLSGLEKLPVIKWVAKSVSLEHSY